ncbi:MAG: response regulator [Nitrospira sp.]|nr:response regulator [Nitrospira sp.]
MKILIADDVKEVRLLFKAVLRCEFINSKVDVVVNGAEAVDAFRTVNYDVLLMDLYMPVKDGYAACLEIQEICRKEKLKMPFVIFCTGYTAPKEIKKLIADKTHYALLRKPVDCEKLIDTIKALK